MSDLSPEAVSLVAERLHQIRCMCKSSTERDREDARRILAALAEAGLLVNPDSVPVVGGPPPGLDLT